MLSSSQRTHLFNEIRKAIYIRENRPSKYISQELTLLYWNIGRLIQTFESGLQKKGSRYVKKIAIIIGQEFTQGWSQTLTERVIRFYTLFQDEEIVRTLSSQLSWSHFFALFPVRNNDKRKFYIHMCLTHAWSSQELKEALRGRLYEKTFPSFTDKEDHSLSSSPVVDFLNRSKKKNEYRLESQILDHIQTCFLECGKGFCLVARHHFYGDILLYNRPLKRLVAIRIESSTFKPFHKEKMDGYLNWLDQHERQGDEDSPLGIILYLKKEKEVIKFFDLIHSEISYLPVLPPLDVLSKKVQEIQESIILLSPFKRKCT